MKQTATTTEPRIAEDPQREKRFRCGYREGYIDAAKQMQRLIEEQGLTTAAATALLVAHNEGPLLEWFKADRNLRLDPPEPDGI